MYNKLQYGLICRGLNKRAFNYWPEVGVGAATGLGGYGLSRLFGMGRGGSALVGLLSALGGGYAANRLKGSFGGAPQQSIFDRIQRKVKSIVPEYEITPEDQKRFKEKKEEEKAGSIVDKQSDSNNPITKQLSDTTSNTSVWQTAQSSTSSTRSKQVSTPMQLKNQQRIQQQQDTAGRQRQDLLSPTISYQQAQEKGYKFGVSPETFAIVNGYKLAQPIKYRFGSGEIIDLNGMRERTRANIDRAGDKWNTISNGGSVIEPDRRGR